MTARDRILGRVRSATLKRDVAAHPGSFEGWRPGGRAGSPVDGFAVLFLAAGGEVVRRPDVAEAARWLADFGAAFDPATVGRTVPDALSPDLPDAPPDSAPLGVSMARGAVAETGSLIMDARDGRRSQLLVPTHVVFVHVGDVHAMLRDALVQMSADLPSAIGLHSGPSKSADIGQIMVKGVHGPGRVIAVVIGA
jgi:L-lactate dehydrogenase complex protein LldG